MSDQRNWSIEDWSRPWTPEHWEKYVGSPPFKPPQDQPFHSMAVGTQYQAFLDCIGRLADDLVKLFNLDAIAGDSVALLRSSVRGFLPEDQLNSRQAILAALVLSEIVQAGSASNFLVVAQPPYSPWIPSSGKQEADVGMFRAISMSEFQQRTSTIDLRSRPTHPFGIWRYRNLADAGIMLVPTAYLETKYIRRNPDQVSNSVSLSRLMDDVEKAERVLALKPCFRDVLPMFLWIVAFDCSNGTNRVPLDGETQNEALFRFLTGDWTGNRFDFWADELSDALGRSQSQPHFEIRCGRRAKAMWLHKTAAYRIVDQRLPPERNVILFAFVPSKIQRF